MGQEQIDRQAASNQNASRTLLDTSCALALDGSNGDDLRLSGLDSAARRAREDTYQSALLYFTLLSALVAILCALVSVVNGRPA